MCNNPKQLNTSEFSCEDSGGFGTPCERVFDDDESTQWTSSRNSIRGLPGVMRDGLYQWGYDTFVNIILRKEKIISGIQIINKVDKKDFYENYKEVNLKLSNDYDKYLQLANGKQNDINSLNPSVRTSYVNVTGLSNWGHVPKNLRLGKSTGFRSGFSEIRLYGCDKGILLI